MRTPHHGGLLVLVLAMATLAACSSSPSPSTLSSSSPAATSAVDAPQLTITPGDGTTTVKPTDRVEVQTSMGTLESVVLTNETGAQIAGFYTPDRIDWKPAVPLGYGRTYTLTATAVQEDQRTERTISFSTVTPGNQTKPTFVSTGGNLLTDDATYGVGMVVVAQFDEPIGDRAAAELTRGADRSPSHRFVELGRRAKRALASSRVLRPRDHRDRKREHLRGSVGREPIWARGRIDLVHHW